MKVNPYDCAMAKRCIPTVLTMAATCNHTKTSFSHKFQTLLSSIHFPKL